MDDLTKAGTMGRTADGKFIYRRTPDNDYIPNTAEHELSHFTDLLKSGRTDAHAGNNMFYQMSKDLTKRVGDGHDNYFLLPTEQKAHMNQLREKNIRLRMVIFIPTHRNGLQINNIEY